MNQPRQGNDGFDGRPLCWNVDPVRDYVANDGRAWVGEDAYSQRCRVIPWNFSRGCKSWASDPSTDPVPMKEGWRCDGCLHYPAELVALAEQRREDRFSRAPAQRQSETAGG